MALKRPPDMRVQWTRSSASPPHSPLTRRPLGNARDTVVEIALFVSLCALLGGCATGSPRREPSLAVLATDTEGSPVPNIRIDVTNLLNGLGAALITDTAGRASFVLEPGRWLVSGLSLGTEPAPSAEVTLDGGPTVKVHLVISRTTIDLLKEHP